MKNCPTCDRPWTAGMNCCPSCGFSDPAFADGVPTEPARAETLVVPPADTQPARFKFTVRPGKQIKDTHSHRQRKLKSATWNQLEDLSNLSLNIDHLKVAPPPEEPPAAAAEQGPQPSSVSGPAAVRHRPRLFWGFRRESFILLALLIETCIVTADYYSPIFDGGKKPSEAVATSANPSHVQLHLINSAQVPVQVKVNNHLIALGKNDSYQKRVPKGSLHISWWCKIDGEESEPCRTREEITSDTDWAFELVFIDDKPVVLRTAPDQQRKSASPEE